jgi:hypothetical protein
MQWQNNGDNMKTKTKNRARAARLQNKSSGTREAKADRKLARDFRLVAAAVRVWETKQ